jgi:hypothetical protein
VDENETMIVREDGDGLLLITQPDHARLAAEIVEAWTADGLPAHPRRETILLATCEHDNGWREPDAAPTVDERGRPHDFASAPAPIRQGVWPRGVTRLAARSPYAAALVAQHALTVYERYRGDRDWTSFFARMERMRDELLEKGVGTPDPFFDDYRFVRLGDLVSLVFCNGWTAPEEELGVRVSLAGDRVVVTPDPFGGRAVPLTVRARRVPARPYASDADLRQALSAAAPVTIAGAAAGPVYA